MSISFVKKKRREIFLQEQKQGIRQLQWQTESRNEEWNDAITALGKIKADVRVPIILKHYYGYSYDEIGRMMKISPGTVKSRVHNGILAVRKELIGNEPETKLNIK